MISMIIGIVGVAITLIAFGLNLLDKLTTKSKLYLSMNIIGAFMAAWYAYDGDVFPFIVLELVWALVASVRLIGVIRKERHI